MHSPLLRSKTNVTESQENPNQDFREVRLDARLEHHLDPAVHRPVPRREGPVDRPLRVPALNQTQ